MVFKRNRYVSKIFQVRIIQCVCVELPMIGFLDFGFSNLQSGKLGPFKNPYLLKQEGEK